LVNERGAIPLIGLILAGIFIAGATVTTIVVVRQNQGDNPGGFTLSVDGASAARNDQGNPIVTVAYTVNFKSDAAAAALITPVSVRCTITQKQLTRSRAFTGEGQVVGTTRIATGSVVIAPGEESRSIGGDYGVVCELTRDGAVLDTANGPGVSIAAASTPPESSTPPSEPPTSTSTELPNVTPYTGRYVAPLVRTAGDETNCTLEGNRVVTAEALTTTTLKIQMDGVDIYSGPLTPDLKFSANVALFPGHAEYYGPLTGQFTHAAPAQLQMAVVTTDPPCSYSFDVYQG
jgi:hypothetical protein